MSRIFPSVSSFVDELEKLGVSSSVSPFMQTRKNRRPIRAHRLIEKEKAYLPAQVSGGPNQDAEKVEDLEVEGGSGFSEKTAEGKRGDKAIALAANARPWIKSAVTSAIPAAVAANFLIPATKDPWIRRKSKIVAGATLLGAGMGVADRGLKSWAHKNKRKAVARKILKIGSVSYEVPAHQMLIRKIASLAGDLRMNGLGGVKRPPFPTEDSKRVANNLFARAKKPGEFSSYAKPRNLIKPGPSLSTMATLPQNG